MNWLLVGIGGFAGAICRFLVGRAVGPRFSSEIPYGTLAVNATGSLLLGTLLGSGSAVREAWPYFLIGSGFLGAFTTFSTYALEGFQLLRSRRWRAFLLYQLLSYGLTATAAAAGWVSARRLF